MHVFQCPPKFVLTAETVQSREFSALQIRDASHIVFNANIIISSFSSAAGKFQANGPKVCNRKFPRHERRAVSLNRCACHKDFIMVVTSSLI